MPVLVMLVAPLAAAAAVWLCSDRPCWPRPAITAVCGAATLAAGITLYPAALSGTPYHLSVPVLGLPWGLTFQADALSLALACLTSLVWIAAGLAAWDYLRDDAGTRRYYVCYLITLTGVLGTFLAGDLLTLLLFFEVMTLASYVLVIHTRTSDAVSAGNLYLYLSIGGSLAAVVGAAVMYQLVGDVSLAARLPGGPWSLAAAGLLAAGFAVKASLMPLHVWLPLAHTAAPAPASAALSGIMIKTGAYCVLRSLMIAADVPLGSDLGMAVIILASVTMLGGVSMALLQHNAKRMLAYHSVSQMGYVMMGVGLAAVLGGHDPMGLAGALFHIINHALFKSALFLVVGIVYLRTHELDMYKLGGLWRTMPAVALLGLVAAMGISGVPGLNGYASKTVLHHALTHAAHDHHILYWVERVFTLTGAGTACSFIKFFGFIFLGRPRSEYRAARVPTGIGTVGVSLLAAGIITLGVRPDLFFTWVFAPLAGGKAKYLANMNLFVPHDLQAVGICLVLGAILFAVGIKTGLFHLHPPRWLSFGWLAVHAGKVTARAWERGTALVSRCLSAAGSFGIRTARFLTVNLRQVDSQMPASHVTLQLANLSFDAAIIVVVLALVLLSNAVVTLLARLW